MNDNRGFTMVQMVVTIIMIVLIAAFSVSNSRDTIVETKVAKAYEEVTEVKKAVMRYAVLSQEREELSAFKIDNLDSYPNLTSEYAEMGEQEYYFLDFKTQGETLNEILEVRNVNDNYIVNIKNLNDIEIFLVNGIKVGNKTLYTDKEIIEIYNDAFAGR